VSGVRIGSIRIKNRNGGYSLGLEYPLIFGDIGGVWAIWNRHTGEVRELIEQHHCAQVMQVWADRRCYELNGIRHGAGAWLNDLAE
jgi:hypothetical protein